jgi:hypothetical protein
LELGVRDLEETPVNKIREYQGKTKNSLGPSSSFQGLPPLVRHKGMSKLENIISPSVIMHCCFENSTA